MRLGPGGGAPGNICMILNVKMKKELRIIKSTGLFITLISHSQCLLSFQEIRNKFEYAGADTKVFNALSFLENEFLKVKIESSVQKQITDHFSQVPSMDTDDIMELCKSLEKSDLSEINLHNQEMCSSCDENHVGVFKCVECDDILCQRCYKAHGRLKVTKTHVVTPL